jgi:hypothetical protein
MTTGSSSDKSEIVVCDVFGCKLPSTIGYASPKSIDDAKNELLAIIANKEDQVPLVSEDFICYWRRDCAPRYFRIDIIAKRRLFVNLDRDRTERREIVVYLSDDGASVARCSLRVELTGTLLTLYSDTDEPWFRADIAPLVEKFKQLKLNR